MRLREVINRLPSDAAETMKASNVWKCSSLDWPHAALLPEELAAAMNRLSAWGRRLLDYWIREVGPLPVQEERLITRSVLDAGMAGAEMRAGIQELCGCGILFAVRKSWGERLLFMPADCYLAWRLSLAQEDVWAELLQSHYVHEAHAHSAAANRLSQDSACGMQPMDAMPGAPLARRLTRAYAAFDRLGLDLTAKGLFPKKTVDTVTRVIAMPSTGIAARLRPVHEDAYPVPFAMALDIALKLGLIAYQDGSLKWSYPALNDWLGGGERAREAELVQLATLLYGCRSPQEAYFATGLLKLEPNRQYRADADMARRPFQTDWMQFLHACGWAHYEADALNGFTFRWLIDPLADRSAAVEGVGDGEPVIVLPDGEIIVPPYAGLAARWQLERIARWDRDDVVAVYRITAESVSSAVGRGITQEALLATLQQLAGEAALPDELVQAVRHWSSGACRTSIEDAVLLRCETKQIADAIAERPGLQELLIERLGDFAFAVRSEEAAKLRKELERAGWPPLRSEAGDGRSASRDTAAPHGSSKKRSGAKKLQPDTLHSFIYNEHAVDRFELLPPMQAGDRAAGDGIPADWPPAWTGQLRSYHHSTRKQMIECALEWGAPIQLVAGGQSVELLPERLDGAAEPWLVSGYIRRESASGCEPVRLTPDMWEEMRIVIPRPAPCESGL